MCKGSDYRKRPHNLAKREIKSCHKIYDYRYTPYYRIAEAQLVTIMITEIVVAKNLLLLSLIHQSYTSKIIQRHT